MENKYTSENIRALKGLEPVRLRPGMYIGSTGPAGLHHLVYEVVDNSIDEAMAGYCSKITVALENYDIVRVEDDGRGFPICVCASIIFMVSLFQHVISRCLAPPMKSSS